MNLGRTKNRIIKLKLQTVVAWHILKIESFKYDLIKKKNLCYKKENFLRSLIIKILNLIIIMLIKKFKIY